MTLAIRKKICSNSYPHRIFAWRHKPKFHFEIKILSGALPQDLWKVCLKGFVDEIKYLLLLLHNSIAPDKALKKKKKKKKRWGD